MNHELMQTPRSATGRRRMLLGMLAALVSGLAPLRALAAEWNKAAFDAHALPDALKAIGAGSAAESDKIELKAPEIAENGAIVPVDGGWLAR